MMPVFLISATIVASFLSIVMLGYLRNRRSWYRAVSLNRFGSLSGDVIGTVAVSQLDSDTTARTCNTELRGEHRSWLPNRVKHAPERNDPFRMLEDSREKNTPSCQSNFDNFPHGLFVWLIQPQ